MAVTTESKVQNGVFTLDGKDFSCAPTSIQITPGTTGDNTSREVLCGNKISGAGVKASDKLTITAISDFSDPNGLVAASWRLRGCTVPFTFQPDHDPTHIWTGTVLVAALPVGGTVAESVDVSVDWDIATLVAPTNWNYKGLGGSCAVPTAIIAPTGGAKEWAFTPTGANFATLAAIKADPVFGDSGTKKPAAFGAGEFVTLGDGSKANYSGTAWQVGPHA